VLAGSEVRHPAELVEAVTLLPTKQLKQRCPSNARVQCWQHHGERFKASEFLVADVSRVLRKLNESGITPIRVLSRLVCTAELNARGAHGENRFLVDLHAMEELIVHIAETVRSPITIVCGKVGSMSAYTQHFAHLNSKQPQIACESPEQSIYQVASFGELRFVRDADATDPLVMLASLVGKYLRELFVERIGKHFTTELTQLRRPSGYHDPITAQFADATEALRAKASFPEDCFERARPRGL
jgi:ribonuclease HII